jgi:outer membrane biosynthesis protein TonB
MQKRSVYIAAGLHVAIFVLATVSLPWLKRDFDIPQPVSVELVDVSKITQTDKIAPVPKPPEKKEEKPEPPKPPPSAHNDSSEAVTPVKAEKTEEDKKEEKKELVDKNALPDKKKKDDKKKKETTEKEPKKDFASVLRNLDDHKEKTPDKTKPDLNPDEKAKPATGQNAPLGTKLTMSEEDALRRQLESCWNVPVGAKDAENLSVDIFMVINPDRTLRSARIVDTSRYNSDTFYRAAADSALRAVMNPKCSPFEVPPDKYDTWKETTVTFNPSEMF